MNFVQWTVWNGLKIRGSKYRFILISSTLLHDNQSISLLLSYMNGMFLKYICLVLLNGIWRKEDINIIRKGRKHTSKSPSSNLPEYHSGTISSIGHGIRPNMACRTVPLRLLQLCSMSIILVPYVILFLVNGRIYKESRYERLKAEFDRMEISEKKRRRTIFWIFIGITLLAGYAAYRLFCRFNMQFLLP